MGLNVNVFVALTLKPIVFVYPVMSVFVRIPPSSFYMQNLSRKSHFSIPMIHSPSYSLCAVFVPHLYYNSKIRKETRGKPLAGLAQDSIVGLEVLIIGPHMMTDGINQPVQTSYLLEDLKQRRQEISVHLGRLQCPDL